MKKKTKRKKDQIQTPPTKSKFSSCIYVQHLINFSGECQEIKTLVRRNIGILVKQ